MLDKENKLSFVYGKTFQPTLPFFGKTRYCLSGEDTQGQATDLTRRQKASLERHAKNTLAYLALSCEQEKCLNNILIVFNLLLMERQNKLEHLSLGNFSRLV